MSVLIERLISTCGYPLANVDNIDQLVAESEYLVLFFTNDPVRYQESNDVAVILPELQRAFQQRFQVAVVDRGSEQALKARFPFNQWPALVFLRRGTQLQAISKVRDWSEYRALIEPLLEQGSGADQRIPNVSLS